MAMIAGLQDFVQRGSPADIGTFQFPCAVMVFKHTFAGTTYICALRRGERGWVLVSYLPETDANNATVINAARAALTAGRTSQEKIVVLGDYVINAVITLDGYLIFELQGKITLAATSNCRVLYALNETEIEVYGGHIDPNGANQTADTDGIYFNACTDCSIHDIKVGGARRETSDGESIELEDCEDCSVINCKTYMCAGSYDHIKLTGTTTECIVALNRCDGTNGDSSNAIQVGTGVSHNLIIGNKIYSPHGASSGIKCHAGNHNIITDNIITAAGYVGIDLLDDASYNFVEGNKIYNAKWGIRLKQSWAGAPDRIQNTIQSNHIWLLNIANATGIEVQDGSDGTEIFENHIHGIAALATDEGIDLQAGSTNTQLRDNRIYDCNTEIIDNGTATIIGSGQIFMGGVYGALDAGATEYIVVSGKASPNPAQDQMRQLVSLHGTFKNFYVRLEVAPGAGNSYTFTLRVNNVNTGVTVTISDTDRTGSDTMNEAVVDPGDHVLIEVVPAGTPAIGFAQNSICFEPH